MFDLEEEDIYIPNTKVMRNYLESLNYTLKPLSGRDPLEHRAICFRDCAVRLEQLKQTNKLYFSMVEPTLTEEQTIFVFDILHVCPDYLTFKEAVEQYINSNP